MTDPSLAPLTETITIGADSFGLVAHGWNGFVKNPLAHFLDHAHHFRPVLRPELAEALQQFEHDGQKLRTNLRTQQAQRELDRVEALLGKLGLLDLLIGKA